MFHIEYIGSHQFSGPIRKSNANNTITFLTGINGTGKSRLLANLARYYCKPSRLPQEERDGFYATSSTKPAKVVSQTFSPFSKFPPPVTSAAIRATSAISDLISDHQRLEDFYLPIGFHRRSRTPSTGAGRRVIEDSLIALSYNHGTKATPLANALKHVGLSPSISIRYLMMASASKLFDPALTERQLNELIVERVDAAINSSRYPVGTDSVLRREAEISGAEKLVDEIAAAFRRLRRAVDGFSFDERELRYQINFEDVTDTQIQILRALILLRRTGLLRVARISFDPSENFDGTSGLMHDVDELSSGQLQLISTVFSLATTVSNNTLVLIDEPELSLHPKWQVDWIRLVEGAFSQYSGCHVFVATHSPLLASAAHDQHHEIISLDQQQSSLGEDDPNSSMGLSEHVSVEEMLLKAFSTAAPYSNYLSNFLMEAIGNVSASRAKRRLILAELDKMATVYADEPTSRSLIEDAKRLLNG